MEDMMPKKKKQAVVVTTSANSSVTEVTDELAEEALEAIGEALNTVLFHHFGQRLYSELSRTERDTWDQLSDELRALAL